MIRLVNEGAAGQPKEWFLAFRRSSESRVVNWLAGGRFKHVAAFGYIAETEHWVFFDWRLRHIDVIVARGKGAEMLIAHYSHNAELLTIKSAPDEGRPWFRFGFWCVPAVKHLIGLKSSALRPDALWRDCIAAGAAILSHGHAESPDLSDPAGAGPDAGSTAATGAA